jgi:hypothetical protein
MRLGRCLNRMQAVALPTRVATRALKAYPALGIAEKLPLAARLYGRVVRNLLWSER